MYSELEGTENGLYTDILKNSTNYKELLKFENFNAYLTKASIIKIGKVLTNFIQNTKYDKISRILPILVSSEIEKVRLFDLIKARIQGSRLIYVPNPPETVGIFYHIYNCLFEELGLSILEEISERIQTQNVRRTRCVNALTSYLHDEKKKDAVIRWFMGQELSISDKRILGFETDITVGDDSLEMIKLIGSFSNEVILLYFDDIELPYEKYGQFAERKLLETLKKLHREVKQLIIIIICLRKSWPKILSLADQSLSSILGPEMEFYDFSQLKIFITKAMDKYWLENDIKPPINQYFPLNEKIINDFFEQSEGDIRTFLKIYLEAIDKIISDEI
ncbi:MAG: hypothetical protein ACFE85_11695 [Candidatus Hodarchaeota archaeon]